MINTRCADEHDSLDVYKWRNDKLSREMSHVTDTLEWRDHKEWFTASLSDDSRLLLICEMTDPLVKLAIVRFDIENDCTLISINLSPDVRGKGFAKKCLKGAMMYFKRLFPHVFFINAEIKINNSASIRTFEGVGFAFAEEKNDVFLYRYAVSDIDSSSRY